MLDFAIRKWEKNKDKLREYFATNKQKDFADSYAQFTQRLIEVIFNDGDYGYGNGEQRHKFDLENCFVEIDFGSYQGTLIFVFAYETFEPSARETFYTTIDYGSCSGCDTLQGICEYDYSELPDESQVNDYMQLALNIIQSMKQFSE